MQPVGETEAEQRQRLLLEHAPIGMAVVALDGHWRQVNPALCRLLGYSADELLTMSFQDITHPDDLDTDLGLLRRMLDGEIESFEAEKRYLTASGEAVWVQLSVVLVKDRAGRSLYFVTQVQDISERKQRHDSLRDLTAMMAHDLRGPIGTMNGLLDVLETSWDRRTEEQRLAVVRRLRETSRMTLGLLENSLTASTLHDRELSAQGAEVFVAEAVRTVLASVPHDEVHVTVDCPPHTVCWVDPGHLVQALSNLVGNAVKYGGPHLRVEARSEGGTTSIVVSDDGPGVPPVFVPHLFDRFSRSDSARVGGQRGSGLGLYIVRDLVRLNGGEVSYADEPGGGAAFTLRIPTTGPAAPAPA